MVASKVRQLHVCSIHCTVPSSSISFMYICGLALQHILNFNLKDKFCGTTCVALGRKKVLPWSPGWKSNDLFILFILFCSVPFRFLCYYPNCAYRMFVNSDSKLVIVTCRSSFDTTEPPHWCLEWGFFLLNGVCSLHAMSGQCMSKWYMWYLK